MIATPELPSWAADARQRIIVALDVSTEAEARDIALELHGAVGAFKIGLQLFTAAGPQIVRRFVDDGFRVFLDLKFHDIPNTVARASVEAAKMGVWMFNMHVAGGAEMMRRSCDAVRDVCDRDGLERPLMIGVTVLTSSDSDTLQEVGLTDPVAEQVTRLARLASNSGLDGVVASPNEVALIREAVHAERFVTVTPGIRSNLATVDDQKRVTTLSQALANGSNYVVIGRPITGSADRLLAVDQMLREIK